MLLILYVPDRKEIIYTKTRYLKFEKLHYYIIVFDDSKHCIITRNVAETVLKYRNSCKHCRSGKYNYGIQMMLLTLESTIQL